jgi:hypothetical protein
MGDLNSTYLASRPASAGMFDEWSRLLPNSDRSAFIEACVAADADDGRLQAVISRYFSTWKTILMGNALSRLQMLAKCEQIRDYVEVVCVEDDYEYIIEEDQIGLEDLTRLYE